MVTPGIDPLDSIRGADVAIYFGDKAGLAHADRGGDAHCGILLLRVAPAPSLAVL